MTASASSGAGPVTIVAIGAGNRTNKYLEYAVRHPERLKLVGVVELNPLRRRTVAEKYCWMCCSLGRQRKKQL